MNFDKLKNQTNRFISATYGRFDTAIEKGKGAECFDFDGKKYIDFTSGIGVNCLGFCDDDWARAVAKQAKKLNHASNLYYTQPMAAAAKLLCEKTGYNNMFFANSGAEANEGAIKTARKYSCDKYGEYRHEIITLTKSFHGRTITTLAATGQAHFHESFLPLTEGFVYATANEYDDVKSKISDNTAAIMLEFIQGEGGVNALDTQFVAQIAALCKQKDILLIADEVQTGVGRTGTFLASEGYGVMPDITTLAKGLGGGLPIGAVLFGEKCKDVLQAGDHGSTFGGNPIVCAGACEVLKKLDDKLLCAVQAKGEYLKQRLEKINGVQAVSGKGLMLGVLFADFTGREVVDKCIEKGVLFLTAKDKLRMLPPLIITTEEIDKALSAIEQSLCELYAAKPL